MSIYGLSIIYRDLKECNSSATSKNADFFPQFLQILRIFFRSWLRCERRHRIWNRQHHPTLAFWIELLNNNKQQRRKASHHKTSTSSNPLTKYDFPFVSQWQR